MNLGDPNLRPIRVLGEGSFGRVFLCHSVEGRKSRKVCVKRIIVRNPKVEMALIKEEVYIISQLRHPHIVQFIRSFMHASTVNIVMEYAPNGTMRNVIERCSPNGVDKAQLLRYFSDMLIGLEYLHIRHVIHRDIKPENMLLSADDRVKFTDFGISNVHVPSKKHQQALGTPLYMAPEVISGGKFDFKSDIWSLGCVLYELCIGHNPFVTSTNSNSTTIDQLRGLVRHLTRPKFDCQAMRQRGYEAIWQRLGELMIVYEPERRISLPELLCLDPCITLTVYNQYFNYHY